MGGLAEALQQGVSEACQLLSSRMGQPCAYAASPDRQPVAGFQVLCSWFRCSLFRVPLFRVPCSRFRVPLFASPGSAVRFSGFHFSGFRCSLLRVPLFRVPCSRFRVPLFASPGSAFPFSRLSAQQKGRARPVWSRLPDNFQPGGGSFAKKCCYTTWTRRPTRRLLLMVFRPL